MKHMEEMKTVALDIGFYQAEEIDIHELEYNEEFRDICKGNVCRNYGKTWACPPAVGSLEECRQRCEQYNRMLLFSCKYEIEDSFDYEGMINSMADFKTLVERYRTAVSKHISEYLLLSNEGCGKCTKCTWPNNPCRFPEQLCHAIEGYGFDVSRLANMAGIRYNNGPNTVTYFGALLYQKHSLK